MVLSCRLIVVTIPVHLNIVIRRKYNTLVWAFMRIFTGSVGRSVETSQFLQWPTHVDVSQGVIKIRLFLQLPDASQRWHQGILKIVLGLPGCHASSFLWLAVQIFCNSQLRTVVSFTVDGSFSQDADAWETGSGSKLAKHGH